MLVRLGREAVRIPPEPGKALGGGEGGAKGVVDGPLEDQGGGPGRGLVLQQSDPGAAEIDGTQGCVTEVKGEDGCRRTATDEGLLIGGGVQERILEAQPAANSGAAQADPAVSGEAVAQVRHAADVDAVGLQDDPVACGGGQFGGFAQDRPADAGVAQVDGSLCRESVPAVESPGAGRTVVSWNSRCVPTLRERRSRVPFTVQRVTLNSCVTRALWAFRPGSRHSSSSTASNCPPSGRGASSRRHRRSRTASCTAASDRSSWLSPCAGVAQPESGQGAGVGGRRGQQEPAHGGPPHLRHVVAPVAAAIRLPHAALSLTPVRWWVVVLRHPGPPPPQPSRASTSSLPVGGIDHPRSPRAGACSPHPGIGTSDGRRPSQVGLRSTYLASWDPRG